MEADSGCTSAHTGGSTSGRDKGIISHMKIKLKFANYMANTANGLLTAIFKKLTRGARPKSLKIVCVRQLREYLG